MSCRHGCVPLLGLCDLDRHDHPPFIRSASGSFFGQHRAVTSEVFEDPGRDPGWSKAFRQAALGMIPGVGMVLYLRRVREGVTDGLTLLRALFLTFVAGFVLVGVVVAVLVNLSTFAVSQRGVPVPPFAGVVVVFGVGALVAGARLSRPMSASTAPGLAGAYRTRFFLRVAFAEAPALAGFAGFVSTGRWWLYPLGAAFTSIGFVRVAPTAANLARDQEMLDADDSALSLIAALEAHQLPPT